MGYCALAVANYFLDLGVQDDVDITPLMIQKLVYISHGYHLAFTAKYDDPNGEPLVDDEFAEAWQYGPVFPSLYYSLRRFGGDPITEPAESNDIIYDEDSGKLRIVSEIPRIDENNKFVCTLLSKVWDAYRSYTGYQLSSVTHKNGTPWDDTVKEHGGSFKNANIKNKVIRNYYLKAIGGRNE